MSSRGSATPIPPEGGSPPGRGSIDVVGLGLNAMDYITCVPSFPVAGRKTEITEVRLEPGGQVATALTTCARLGLGTRYIGSVGSDDLGRLQLDSLKRERVDVSGVRVVEGAASQMAIAILEAGIGERTILWHRDPRLIFPENQVSRAAILSGRVLHLDGRDSRAALRAAEWASDAGIPVVIDIDKVYDETTRDLLGLVDYLIAAEDFAFEFTGTANPDEAVAALKLAFPDALCGITLGGAGAVFMLDGRPERSRAFEVDVRDTTGAGDVFHGAFIYGVLQTWDLRSTIRFAHAAAAIKCTTLGARTGIPGLDGVRQFLATAAERGP